MDWNRSIVVKILAGAKDFSCLQSGHIGSGAHSASPIQWVSGTVFLGVGGGLEQNVVTNLYQTIRHHTPEDYNIRIYVLFHCIEFVPFLRNKCTFFL